MPCRLHPPSWPWPFPIRPTLPALIMSLRMHPTTPAVTLCLPNFCYSFSCHSVPSHASNHPSSHPLSSCTSHTSSCDPLSSPLLLFLQPSCCPFPIRPITPALIPSLLVPPTPPDTTCHFPPSDISPDHPVSFCTPHTSSWHPCLFLTCAIPPAVIMSVPHTSHLRRCYPPRAGLPKKVI